MYDVPTYLPLQGGVCELYQKWLSPCPPGAHFCLLCGHLDPLRFPREVFMIANLAKRFFSLPSNISFHLQPQAGPWLSLWSREYKDMGPSGLTPRALLSITASASLLPFTPGSWTHRCQPGNNPQTIEA